MRGATAALMLGLVVAASPAAGAGAGSPATCFRYTDRLTLSGKLSIKTFPGPPNYESVAQGDKPETVLVLLLSRSVCMEANNADESGLDAAVSGIRAVQLAATSKQLGLSPGRSVRVSGTVFAAHTGHHHTPIVMENVRAEETP